MNTRKSSRTCLFPPEDQQIIREKCASFIAGGSISKERLMKALEGTAIMGKYSVPQLRTRINYEKKL